MASRKRSSSVPQTQWQLEYEYAIQETDRKTLFKRIEVAEAAILRRREILAQSPDGSVERSWAILRRTS
jgi:hypothetical protein